MAKIIDIRRYIKSKKIRQEVDRAEDSAVEREAVEYFVQILESIGMDRDEAYEYYLKLRKKERDNGK